MELAVSPISQAQAQWQVPDPTQGVEKGVENIGEHSINLSQKSWIQQLIKSMTFGRIFIFSQIKNPVLEGIPPPITRYSPKVPSLG